MNKITRKFITYYMPGSFVSQQSSKEVQSFDIPKSIPRDVFAFDFHQTEYVVDGKKEYEGKTKSQGQRHIIGKIIHLADIPDTPENRILRSNIKCNSATNEGIKTHLGNWQFKDADSVVHSAKEFKFTKPLIWDNIKSEAA